MDERQQSLLLAYICIGGAAVVIAAIVISFWF